MVFILVRQKPAIIQEQNIDIRGCNLSTGEPNSHNTLACKRRLREVLVNVCQRIRFAHPLTYL